MDNTLKKTVLLAAKLREDSYDHKAANAAKDLDFVDYAKFYTLSLNDAAEKASEQIENNALAFPVYLLLSCCWNDILSWAES